MTMNRRGLLGSACAGISLMSLASPVFAAAAPRRRTTVDIAGDAFLFNGRPTFPGRIFRGSRIEGLLFTSRMANCIIDDQNPETRGMWAYRDGPWDPDRNTSEFIAALPKYRAHGLNSVSLNIQGGSLMGYGWNQPWRSSGYTADGALLPAYRARLLRVLEALDANDMVAVLGLFYFVARPALRDDAAVIRATDEVTDLICENGFTNVIVEVGNEIDLAPWKQDIIKPPRSHELVERIQTRSRGRIPNKAGRLLVSTSLLWPNTSPERLIRVADYILFHGNALPTPGDIRDRASALRASPAYRGQPLLINEDDHFDFEKSDNHMLAAIQSYTGWGYFDYREIREPFEAGYQSLPIDWGINSPRKKGFFDLLAQVTDSTVS